jgi:hypothetical protein
VLYQKKDKVWRPEQSFYVARYFVVVYVCSSSFYPSSYHLYKWLELNFYRFHKWAATYVWGSWGLASGTNQSRVNFS